MKMLAIDKANHAWIGSYAALAGYVIGMVLELQLGVGLTGQIHAAIGNGLAALGREIYGMWKGRAFDPRDVAATVMGGAPVVIVAPG